MPQHIGKTRNLPDHITITNCEAYQVRIVRSGVEHSASFAWSKYETTSDALLHAMKWRDGKLAELPSAENGRGSFRREAMKHKKSYGRVGITRYLKTDRRKIGSPVYLVFGVNWVDGKGQPRVKQFQVGKVDTFNWEDELHAALTAEAFRTHWEYCQTMKLSFDPDAYRNWKAQSLYPFSEQA